MTKAANSEWLRLARAAMLARNDLRTLAATLMAAIDAGDVPTALVTNARDIAARHATGLQLALKHPEAELVIRRMNRDLPCWSEGGGQ
jgi:hypothetical protein